MIFLNSFHKKGTCWIYQLLPTKQQTHLEGGKCHRTVDLQPMIQLTNEANPRGKNSEGSSRKRDEAPNPTNHFLNSFQKRKQTTNRILLQQRTKSCDKKMSNKPHQRSIINRMTYEDREKIYIHNFFKKVSKL